jgi:hypothetical protein
MSLNFPISLAGKRGGIDLKEGLVRWWEDGDKVDKVSGTATIGGLRGNKVLAPPAPFTGTFDPNRDAGAITSKMNSPATNFSSYTIFMLAGRKAANAYRSLFSSDGYSVGDEMVEATSQRLQIRANSSANTNITHSVNQWNTFVYSKDGDTASIYKDGVLIATRTGSYQSSNFWRCWDCQNTSFAIWGKSDIPWTQEHVDAFHNEGNYVQYVDL